MALLSNQLQLISNSECFCFEEVTITPAGVLWNEDFEAWHVNYAVCTEFLFFTETEDDLVNGMKQDLSDLGRDLLRDWLDKHWKSHLEKGLNEIGV